MVAQWLRVDAPPKSTPPVTLELSSLRHVEGDIVDYTVGPDSRAAGRIVRDLALPDGVVIALIARDQQIIPPQGNTRIQPGDHVVVVLRPGARPLVNRVFARGNTEPVDLPFQFEFALRGNTTVRILEEFYDISMNAPPDQTLDQVLRERLGDEPLQVGATVRFGQIGLRVRSLVGERIEEVGMTVLPDEEPSSITAEEPQDDRSA